MVTVKDAAAALGFDERTIRDKLASGEWKGEKRLVGMKEKWFMYHGEFERQVERLRSLRAERTSVEGIEQVFAVEATAIAMEATDVELDAEEGRAAPTREAQTGLGEANFVDKFWSQLSERFLDRIEMKDRLIGELQTELLEKERQLKLLPDLQAAAEREQKARAEQEFESEALRKQLAAVQEQKEAELAALRAEVDGLSEELNKARSRWWKRLFIGKS